MGIVVADSPLAFKAKGETRSSDYIPQVDPVEAWELALVVSHGSPGFVVSCREGWSDPPLFWAGVGFGGWVTPVSRRLVVWKWP